MNREALPLHPAQRLRLRTDGSQGILPGDGFVPLYDYLDCFPVDIDISVEAQMPPNNVYTGAEWCKVSVERIRNYLTRYYALQGRQVAPIPTSQERAGVFAGPFSCSSPSSSLLLMNNDSTRCHLVIPSLPRNLSLSPSINLLDRRSHQKPGELARRWRASCDDPGASPLPPSPWRSRGEARSSCEHS